MVTAAGMVAGYRGGYHHDHDNGGAAAAAILGLGAAAIIGGVIASQQPRYYAPPPPVVYAPPPPYYSGYSQYDPVLRRACRGDFCRSIARSDVNVWLRGRKTGVNSK